MYKTVVRPLRSSGFETVALKKKWYKGNGDSKCHFQSEEYLVVVVEMYRGVMVNIMGEGC